jgi:hypothetical protein
MNSFLPFAPISPTSSLERVACKDEETTLATKILSGALTRKWRQAPALPRYIPNADNRPASLKISGWASLKTLCETDGAVRSEIDTNHAANQASLRPVFSKLMCKNQVRFLGGNTSGVNQCNPQSSRPWFGGGGSDPLPLRQSLKCLHTRQRSVVAAVNSHSRFSVLGVVWLRQTAMHRVHGGHFGHFQNIIGSGLPRTVRLIALWE